MIDRREFLRIAGLTSAWPYATAWAQPSGVIVDDLHSQLNATRVHRVVEPDTLDAVRSAIAAARRQHRAVCIAGGRHAMGAQAFATDGATSRPELFLGALPTWSHSREWGSA